MNEQATSTQADQSSAASQSNAAQQAQQAQQLFGGESQQQQAGGQQQQQTQQAATQQQSAPTQAQLSPEQLRELVQSTAREAVQAARPPEPGLTQDQINQMLNVYSVSPAVAMRMAKALGVAEENLPNAAQELAAVFNEMLDAKTRQAITMAAVQLEALKRNDLASIQNQLKPVLTFTQQQNEQRLRDAFLTKYPDLKGYEPILEMVYQQMVAEKMRFNTEEEAFTAANNRVRQVLQKLPGQNGQHKQQQQASGGASRMSTVSMGGQSGASSAGGQMSDQEKLARKLFASAIG